MVGSRNLGGGMIQVEYLLDGRFVETSSASCQCPVQHCWKAYLLADLEETADVKPSSEGFRAMQSYRDRYVELL